MPNVAAMPPRNAGHDSSGSRRKSKASTAPPSSVFLDAPVVAGRNRRRSAGSARAMRRSARGRDDRCRRRGSESRGARRAAVRSHARCCASAASRSGRSGSRGDERPGRSRRSADGVRAGAPCCAAPSSDFCPANERPPRCSDDTRRRRARSGSPRNARACRSRSPRRSRGRTPDRTRRSRRSVRAGRRSRSPRPWAGHGYVGTAARASAARTGLGIVAVARHVVLAESRKRADLRVVGERRYGSDARLRRRAAGERVSQPVGDDRVGVEQHDVGARQQSHAPVRGRREAAVAPVAQELDVRQRAPRERGEVRGDRRDRATRRRSAPAGNGNRCARSTLSTQRARSSTAL